MITFKQTFTLHIASSLYQILKIKDLYSPDSEVLCYYRKRIALVIMDMILICCNYIFVGEGGGVDTLWFILEPTSLKDLQPSYESSKIFRRFIFLSNKDHTILSYQEHIGNLLWWLLVFILAGSKEDLIRQPLTY